MIFFRQKLEEVITLPPPPKDDMKEALQVRDIVNVSKVLRWRKILLSSYSKD